MPRPHQVPPRTTSDIAQEWDQLAPLREKQIERGTDTSYLSLLKPFVLARIAGHAPSILDVGCGVGALTAELARSDRLVVGIDPSSRSIEIARARQLEGLVFENRSVEDYAALNQGRRFHTIVANMTLQCVVDLHAVVRAVSSLLDRGGAFIWTVPHPWFWPRYWRYESSDWFNYQSEIFIEAPFRITHESSEVLSTHIHRPLTMYVQALAASRLVSTEMVELPSGSSGLPRFLGAIGTPSIEGTDSP